jgi:hypothetical protein
MRRRRRERAANIERVGSGACERSRDVLCTVVRRRRRHAPACIESIRDRQQRQ